MKRVFILIFICIPLLLCAQKKEGRELADSLLGQLPRTAEDTGRVMLLGRLSSAYSAIIPDSGVAYGLQALSLAQRLGWAPGLALANNALGNNYLNKSNNGLALKCFTAALRFYEKGGDLAKIGSCLGNISNVYSYESNYPAALEYNFKSLKIFEELGDKMGMAVNMANTGVIYRNQSNYAKALEYNMKALKLAEELHYNGTIANVYGNLGNIYMDRQIYDSALLYDLKGLEMAEQSGRNVQVAVKMMTVGNVYLAQGDFSSALEYNFKALEISRQLGDKLTVTSSLGSIGDCYLYIARDAMHAHSPAAGTKKQNLARAISYLSQALDTARQIDDLDNVQIVCKSLSEAYLLSGSYVQALNSYKDYIAARDSIYSEDKNIKIAELETTRNLDLKEKDVQIEQLKAKNKRNERFIYIAGIVALLVVMGIVLSKFFKQRHSNRQLSREKRRHLRHIKVQENVLKDIAHVQAHDVRGSVATLLGLAKLFNQDDPADPANQELMQDVITVTERLDKIIKEVVIMENEVSKGQNLADGK